MFLFFIIQFSRPPLSEIPSWITQVYDENWLDEMINEMEVSEEAKASTTGLGLFMADSVKP